MDEGSKSGVSLNVTECMKERRMSSFGEFETLAENLVYGAWIWSRDRVGKGVGIEADFIDSHQHPFYFMLTLLPCALLFPSMSSFNSELPLFFPF